MIRLTPLFLTAMLAGCGAPIVIPFIPGAEVVPEGPPPLPPLPPEVATFLPPGTPPSVVFQDSTGCYLYSIEVTDPPSGFPVRDAAGNQICPGVPVVTVVPVAPVDAG